MIFNFVILLFDSSVIVSSLISSFTGKTSSELFCVSVCLLQSTEIITRVSLSRQIGVLLGVSIWLFLVMTTRFVYSMSIGRRGLQNVLYGKRTINIPTTRSSRITSVLSTKWMKSTSQITRSFSDEMKSVQSSPWVTNRAVEFVSSSTVRSTSPNFSELLSEKYFNTEKAESEIYNWWEKSGRFTPEGAASVTTLASGLKCDESTAPSWTCPMPPPNVTGHLHMGHAMFLALQDIMTRFHRMRGYAALWLPGT